MQIDQITTACSGRCCAPPLMLDVRKNVNLLEPHNDYNEA